MAFLASPPDIEEVKDGSTEGHAQVKFKANFESVADKS